MCAEVTNQSNIIVYNLRMNLHEETKCWWLTEDTDGHVVYVTVAQLIIILDMVLYTRKTNEYNCERKTRK